jgi:hypothetical protein
VLLRREAPWPSVSDTQETFRENCKAKDRSSSTSPKINTARESERASEETNTVLARTGRGSNPGVVVVGFFFFFN